MRSTPKKAQAYQVPSIHDWRTTDEDEIHRRRERARTESFRIANQDARHPIFSNFRVASHSGLTYSVEIRDLRRRQFACDCVDFRINGLGTCKHIEAVLLHLEGRFRKLYATAAAGDSPRLDVIPDLSAGTLRVHGARERLPKPLRDLVDDRGAVRKDPPEEVVAAFERWSAAKRPDLRVSQEVGPWLSARRRSDERRRLRHEYEQRVRNGEWPIQETKVPLFPYQREGMLHLAFTERALLADEMGLGKTIQAIAACALLHRLGVARRVLVVTPASLKSEWEEQIQRFTDLPLLLVFGGRRQRLQAYGRAPFFTIVNYEQMLADALEVNDQLRPDVVVLDEAQRIRNWSTKTTQAIKRLRSRYAFVLTGTPIENRLDDLHSLMDFLDPTVLGPLFRFNREYYELDDRGRPAAYRNLAQLHERIRPFLLRRRKADVEKELPDRTDRQLFVPLSPPQRAEYEDHEAVVARLAHAAKRRPLTQQEQEKLLRHLAMMRMVCDTPYILNPDDRTCPKLAEIEKVLESCRDNDAKAIVFSEWERMLELVRDLCRKLGLGFAWHTGSVPQRRRRAEINAFKGDADCRVFLSTDSGAAGLNLQNASVVINCDLPWNPAKLEQRIARAWRKNQTRAVTVVNLVTEDTIEHRMLETLAGKQALADGVLDRRGDLGRIPLRSGRQAFLSKLQQLLVPRTPPETETRVQTSTLPADRALGFSQEAQRRINGALVECEERFPKEGAHSVLYVVVERDAAQWREKLTSLHADYFGPGHSDPLAPVHLEVVDRATHEALERLAAAGLLTRTTRGGRPLFPAPDSSTPAPLSEHERQEVGQNLTKARHHLRLAQVLGPAGFAAESFEHLRQSALPLGRALAIRNRLPEPDTLETTVLPPLSLAWEDSLAVLRRLVGETDCPWEAAAAALERVASGLAVSLK